MIATLAFLPAIISWSIFTYAYGWSDWGLPTLAGIALASPVCIFLGLAMSGDER